MKSLDNITLLGLDCVDIDRLIQAAEICCKDFNFAKIKLLSSVPSEDNRVVSVRPITSIKEYSQFILKELNDFVDTEFVLLIQYDGFILNPAAWDNEYLKYDYIGAPLLVDDKLVVGNGGFSLRSKKMLGLTQNDPQIRVDGDPNQKYSENEDWIISVIERKHLESLGVKFAPVALAHQFSFEKNKEYGAYWNGQFGFHGLKWTDISAWTKTHPEYQIDNALTERPDKHF